MAMTTTSIEPLLRAVKQQAESAGVFAGCEIRDGQLVCKAANSAAPSSYRIGVDGGTVYVSLVMADRWLSESIESDLVEFGDKLEELIEDELVELGAPVRTLAFEHFRSKDLLFTFRSPLPIRLEDAAGGPGLAEASRVAGLCLLAYEQCFRRLGDMDAGGEDAD